MQNSTLPLFSIIMIVNSTLTRMLQLMPAAQRVMHITTARLMPAAQRVVSMVLWLMPTSAVIDSPYMWLKSMDVFLHVALRFRNYAALDALDPEIRNGTIVSSKMPCSVSYTAYMRVPRHVQSQRTFRFDSNCCWQCMAVASIPLLTLRIIQHCECACVCVCLCVCIGSIYGLPTSFSQENDQKYTKTQHDVCRHNVAV